MMGRPFPSRERFLSFVPEAQHGDVVELFCVAREAVHGVVHVILQRKHWCIENKLHWCLDCCFHEDDVHVTLGHAAVVINMFRKLCMQMLKADVSVKDSLTGKRQRCAWSFPYALSVVKNWAFS